MKRLIYLLVVGFVLTALASCTTESVEEVESLQNLEDQSADGSGAGGGNARPMSAYSNG